MNNKSIVKSLNRAGTLASVTLSLAVLVATQATALRAAVLSPSSNAYGKSYAEWSSKWWEWALELPMNAHNPFLASPQDFDITTGQAGKVWFLMGNFDVAVRSGTIPAGTSLFIPILDVESSTLEEPPFYGATEPDQRAIAKWFADHVVVSSLFFEVDGHAVPHLEQYRFSSPQYSFNAPTPWLYGPTGGTGTSVGDGYYILLTPLSKGAHTLHYGGTFHFAAGELGDDPVDLTADQTYNIKVGGLE